MARAQHQPEEDPPDTLPGRFVAAGPDRAPGPWAAFCLHRPHDLPRTHHWNAWPGPAIAARPWPGRIPSGARAGGSARTRWTTPTCTSSTPARRLEPGGGHRQTGSFPSTRAWACAPSAARKPPLPIPTTSPSRLLDAARTVRAIGQAAGQRAQGIPKDSPAAACTRRRPHRLLDSTAKVALLETASSCARAPGPAHRAGHGGLASEYDVVLVARADGTLAADVRPLVRLSVTVIAEQGRREVGSAGGGGRFGRPTSPTMPDCRLRARPCAPGPDQPGCPPAPAGEMTVVLGLAGPACCCTRPWATGWRATSTARAPRLQRPHRPARGGQGVTVLDDGTIARPARLAQRRRRRPRHAAQRADRGRHPEGLYPGQPERPPDGRQAHGQRPARELRPHAHARMTNTYMLAATRSDGNRRLASRRAVRHQLWWRAGGHHQRQVRFLGQPGPLGGKRQDFTRQGCHDRIGAARKITMIGNDMRPGQRCRHLWQRGPKRARGRGPAHTAHRWPDGGRQLPDAVVAMEQPTTGLLKQSFAVISSFARRFGTKIRASCAKL